MEIRCAWTTNGLYWRRYPAEVAVVDVTLDSLGKLLEDLQREAAHHRHMYDFVLKRTDEMVSRMDALASRVDLVDSRVGLSESRLSSRIRALDDRVVALEGRIDALEERMNGRFDTLETLLRERR
jgi:predicted nuclease with TOPRIM domain